MREVFIRPRAVADLEGIWLYTRKRWSVEQADRYLRSIDGALLDLARDPDVGRSAESIRAGYRFLRVGRHLIFYTLTEQVVSIRRVLHDRMDLHRHL